MKSIFLWLSIELYTCDLCTFLHVILQQKGSKRGENNWKLSIIQVAIIQINIKYQTVNEMMRALLRCLFWTKIWVDFASPKTVTCTFFPFQHEQGLFLKFHLTIQNPQLWGEDEVLFSFNLKGDLTIFR